MKLLRLLAALPLLVWPGSAFAICPDCSACWIDDADILDFGTYSLLDAQDKSATALVNLTCAQQGEKRGGTLSIYAGNYDGAGPTEFGVGYYLQHVSSLTADAIMFMTYHDPAHTIAYHTTAGWQWKTVVVPAGRGTWNGVGDVYALILNGQNPEKGRYVATIGYYVEY